MSVTILMAIMSAWAADPVVSLGRNVVMDAPLDSNSAEAAAAWTAVLADCAEEAAPGRLSIVDRTDVLHSKGEAVAVRELKPAAVVVTQPVPSTIDPQVWAKDLEGVIRTMRMGEGPVVFLVGAVAPTVAQVAVEGSKRSRQETERLQADADKKADSWNKSLLAIAESDDGIWFIDVWGGWPREGRRRSKLTSEGWRLSDQAQARIGAVICEEMLKRLQPTK